MDTTSITHLVVTAPNSSVCSIYEKQLNYMCRKIEHLQRCKAICVSDPEGIRVGSGGGTLNAISELSSIIGRDSMMSSKVVLIHSGGDSRRSPLNSISGKAWSTLNTPGDKSGVEGSPMYMLLNELVPLIKRAPLGTVLVASSDVLVNLAPSETFTIPTLVGNGITVVTVAESLELAKNHGVIGSSGFVDNTALDKGITFPACVYLQKPSICEMKESASTVVLGGVSPDHPLCTLIDTGIVVISGCALEALMDLCDHPVVGCCTDIGLTRAIIADEGVTKASIALRLELYSDFLHALQLSDGQCDFATYLSRLPLDSQQASEDSPLYKGLYAVWERLRSVSLYGLHIPGGVFCHLGTSAELQELVCTPLSHTDSSLASSPGSTKLQSLCGKYRLATQVRSTISCNHEHSSTAIVGSTDFIAMGSVLSSADDMQTSIGAGTVIDNCVLHRHIKIGSSCVLSHIGSLIGESLRVPDSTMVQQIPLRGQTTDSDRQSRFVLIALGVHDNVKAASDSTAFKVCGLSLDTMLEAGNCDYSDLWNSTNREFNSLWNAKLFPIVDDTLMVATKNYDCSLQSVLLWFTQIAEYSCKPNYNHIIEIWKNSTRLALNDILAVGSASSMLTWRIFMRSTQHVAVQGKQNLDYAANLPSDDALLPSSPVWRAPALSVVYEVVGDVFRIISDELQSSARNISADYESLTASLMLGLACIRLCMDEKASFGGDNVHIITRCTMESIDLSESTVEVVLQSFDRMWQVSFSRELTVTMHQYLLSLVDFYTPVKELWSIISVLWFNMVHINRYPRLLFLCEWLRSEGLLKVSTNESHQQYRENILELLHNSPSDLSQLVACIFARISVDVLLYKELDEEDSGDLIWTAQTIVRCQLERSLLEIPHKCPVERHGVRKELDFDRVSFATGPVRVDIAGGWSDTAPISYEYPGAVVNVAVDIDGVTPLWCGCRFISDPEIRLKSIIADSTSFLSRESQSFGFQFEESVCINLADFTSLTAQSRKNHHSAPACVLLKACLVVMEVINSKQIHQWGMESYLRGRFGGGIEITSCAKLPSGSGMGGSSIVAAVIMKALYGLVHNGQEALHEGRLVSMVSQVEQLLTTGGGWQDQVGGIYGGVKICRSLGRLPLSVSVCPLPLPPRFVSEIQSRMVLVYSGVQRLAKSTLVNALSRHSRFPIIEMREEEGIVPPSTPSSWGVVPNLIRNAEACFASLRDISSECLEDENRVRNFMDALSASMNRYWKQKRDIAWGSQTPDIQNLLHRIESVCDAASACGAGAGGFVACILREGSEISDLQDVLNSINRENEERRSNLTLHTIEINEVGISVKNICSNEYEDILMKAK